MRTDRRTEKQADGRVDGQTDMAKLTVAFHKFANTPNKVYDVPENAIYCFFRFTTI